MSVLIGIIIFLLCCLIMQYINMRGLRLDVKIKEQQIKEIRNNFEIYRSVSDCESGEMGDLRNRNAELLMENMQLKSIVSAYRNTFGNGFHSTYSSSTIPKDTVEAVKYAMKHAHPDNRGNAEDFIKFKKCYEELARK